MNKIKRYLRQITLDEIGVKGQNRLLQSRVLVIGAGGLGCPLVQILASSGIGHISILDYDRVEIHNLARQMIFKKEDVGRYKAEVISKYINDFYPDCSINHYNIFFNSNNADRLISNHDIVIDATDDINTRYLINDNCVFYDKPLVYAALYKYEGQLTVFNYKNGPSLRCLYPNKPSYQEIPTCEHSGMLATVSSTLAQFQATEVIKVLLDLPGVLSGKLWYYNFLNHDLRLINFELIPHQYEYSNERVRSESIKTQISLNQLLPYEIYNWVDIRSPEEIPLLKWDFIIRIPITSKDFKDQLQKKCDPNKPILFFCQSGKRAKQAQELSRKFISKECFALLNSTEDISSYLRTKCK